MKQSFLLLIALVLGLGSSAQTLLSFDSIAIVQLKDNQIHTPNDDVLFSFQGNIIFEGNSSSSENIYYTLDGNDLFDKKKVTAYDKKGRNDIWAVKKGTVFFKGTQLENQVIKMELTEDFLSFYSAFNDSLLAYLPSPQNITSAQTFALSQIVWHQFEIEAAYDASKTTSLAAPLAEGVLGIVAPINGIGIIWVWDGRYLKPLYDRNQYLVWQFDGSKLSPNLASRNHEEFSWDGETFKPFWGGHPKNEWVWQGNILRQIWNANYNKEFLYEDGIIRPRFGGFGENEWEVQGEVPKAIITAIALGVLFR